jgi:hypothetical protein
VQFFGVFKNSGTGFAGGLATDVGCGEEYRLDTGEVVFLAHPLHKHAADHTPPPDESYARRCSIGSHSLVDYAIAQEIVAGVLEI